MDPLPRPHHVAGPRLYHRRADRAAVQERSSSADAKRPAQRGHSEAPQDVSGKIALTVVVLIFFGAVVVVVLIIYLNWEPF